MSPLYQVVETPEQALAGMDSGLCKVAAVTMDEWDLRRKQASNCGKVLLGGLQCIHFCILNSPDTKGILHMYLSDASNCDKVLLEPVLMSQSNAFPVRSDLQGPRWPQAAQLLSHRPACFLSDSL